MISVAISLRDSFPGTLRGDTLHGEGRWERQCLEAVLQCPEIDRVYTANRSSCGPQAEPLTVYSSKFHDGIPNDEYKNTILIAMDFWTASIHKEKYYRGMLFNIYHGLWEHDLPLVEQLKKQYDKKLLFTYGFPNSTSGPYIEGMVGKDYVEVLPVPACPFVRKTSNFDKNIILWNQKFIYQHMNDRSIEVIFEWVRDKLKSDSNKKFVVLTAFRPADLKWHGFLPDCTEQFWSYGCAQILSSVKDQVVIHGCISWQEVLDYNAESKLVVGHPPPYGGTATEAAMYGIPSFGRAGVGTLVASPNYLAFPDSPEEYVGILEKLYTDKEYFDFIGSSHRDYVEENYTYAAFTKNLLKLFRDRGMI